jgi:hypothetical protein
VPPGKGRGLNPPGSVPPGRPMKPGMVPPGKPKRR